MIAEKSPVEVRYLPPGQLIPSKHNSRSHSPTQIDEIVRSIRAFGWTRPIIIDEASEILAGHGAHLAALQMAEQAVPTITIAGLTAAQKRAYRVADNKLAERSEWDIKALTGEFADLTAMGFDASLTGFSAGEIGELLNPKGKAQAQPDPGANLEQRVVSEPGDLWYLGNHRVICGDNGHAKTIKTLMGGRQAQCVFTDPPYGVSYQDDDGTFRPIASDDKRRAALLKMLTSALATAARHTREDAGWYIWHASSTRETFAQAMRAVELVELAYIVWEKPAAVMGWGDYRWAHEPCFYAARQGATPQFHGDRTNTTVWRVEIQPTAGQAVTTIGNGLILSSPDGAEIYLSPAAPKAKKVRHLMVEPGTVVILQPKTDADDLWQVARDNHKDAIHPTMKPVELARRACVNSAQAGDVVLDPFGGSGSTLMACEATGRHGYVAELDPHYVDAIVRRWETVTGKQAVHAVSSQTFTATAEARGKV